MEKNIKTAERKGENITVQQGKELTIERDWDYGDDLLYCADKRIYLGQLKQKMSWKDWGYKGLGIPYTGINCEYTTADDDTCEIHFDLYIDNEFWAEWDEAKMAKMVKKYGYKINQAKRAEEIAEREKEEREFEASVKDEELVVDVVDGSVLLRYGARQIFAQTLRYIRMISPDYTATDIDPDEQWSTRLIDSCKKGFRKLVQKYGVADAYSIYPC